MIITALKLISLFIFTVACSEASTSSEVVVLKGVLRNFNTVEDFKNADKAALLEALADQVSLPHIYLQTSTQSVHLRSGPNVKMDQPNLPPT